VHHHRPAHYPFSHIWPAYSPFDEIEPVIIGTLEELPSIAVRVVACLGLRPCELFHDRHLHAYHAPLLAAMMYPGSKDSPGRKAAGGVEVELWRVT